VQHGIISFGTLAELCNCCSESCTVLTGYRRGVTDLARPTGLRATRTDACDGCRGRDGRICEDICPYGHAPGSDECRGCGLCAFHCPNGAIEMVRPPDAEPG
jgi:Fe-S-cluster-containing hydrogenase component 2